MAQSPDKRMQRLRTYLVRAVSALGVRPERVVRTGQRKIVVQHEGFEIVWADKINMDGRERPGWMVREIVPSEQTGTGESDVLDIVYVTVPKDLVGVAKQTALAIAERRIESRIDGVRSASLK